MSIWNQKKEKEGFKSVSGKNSQKKCVSEKGKGGLQKCFLEKLTKEMSQKKNPQKKSVSGISELSRNQSPVASFFNANLPQKFA